MEPNFNPNLIYFKRKGNFQNFKNISFSQSESVIGRIEDANISICSKIISRKQSKVEFRNGRLWIEDLQSSNGTYVNGDKIRQPTLIDVGDLIGFGCNTKEVDSLMKEDNLIYEAVLPEIVSLSSDEETEADDEQVQELCNNLQNSVVEHTTLCSESLIVVSSGDEEDETDQNWKNKLSQKRNRSPPPSQDAETIPNSILEMREVTVLIPFVSENEIAMYSGIRKNEKSSSNDGKTRGTQNSELKRKKSRRYEELIDSESEDESSTSESTGKKLKTSDKNNNRPNNNDDFECIDDTNEPGGIKLTLRRKIDASRELNLPKVSKKSFPLRRQTICFDNFNFTGRNQSKNSEIAQTLLGKKEEVGDKQISEKQSKFLSKRRNSVAQAHDVFSKIKELRVKRLPLMSKAIPSSRRKSCDAERREKLRQLSTLENQKKTSETITSKVNPNTKAKAPKNVKVTQKSRNDIFLEEIQPVAVKKASSTVDASHPARNTLPLQQKRTNSENSGKLFQSFASETETCNNLNFYKHYEALSTGCYDEFAGKEENLNIEGSNREECLKNSRQSNKPLQNLKSCFKTTLTKHKKNVSFSLTNITHKLDTVYNSRNLLNTPQSNSRLNDELIQSKSKSQIEIEVMTEILAWKPEWFELSYNDIPEFSDVIPLKDSYETLEDYKTVLNPLLKMEFFGKIATKSKITNSWIFMTNLGAEKSNTGLTVLNFSSHSTKSLSKGSLLILKFKTHASIQEERQVFGYVAEGSNNHNKTEQIWKVETLMNIEEANQILLIKAQTISYVKSDLKSLMALRQLKFSPLISSILQPEKNTSKINETGIIQELKSKEYCCLAVEGGPGTGKSRFIYDTLSNVFKNLNDPNKLPTILVCAMTNSCVDELFMTLRPLAENTNLKIIRTGVIDKTKEEVRRFSLPKMIEEKRKIEKLDYSTARSAILEAANIIFSTVNSSYELSFCRKPIEICFLDEASQITEGELSIPLSLGLKKMILLGDTQQLQPALSLQHLKNMRFDRSFFSRMVKTFQQINNKVGKPIYKLCEQYRMHPEIFEFPNEMFYSGSIVTPSELLKRMPAFPLKPYVILSIESSQVLTQDTSSYNLEEIELVNKLVEFIISKVDPAFSIGVISPYVRQNTEIMKSSKYNDRTQVLTIDAAQGMEKDIIILTSTRSTGLGFLDNRMRMNVALTRAKRALYICGNFDHLQTNDLWRKLTENAVKRGLLYKITKNQISEYEIGKYLEF